MSPKILGTVKRTGFTVTISDFDQGRFAIVQDDDVIVIPDVAFIKALVAELNKVGYEQPPSEQPPAAPEYPGPG